jgi:hypothetical protein
MMRPGSRAAVPFLVVLSAALAVPAMRAQDTSLRAERTAAFAVGKAIVLNAKVGPVSIQSVEFGDRGRAASGLPGLRSTPSETSTVLRGRFIVENPSVDEWEVAFTIEFRDRNGKVIDRAVRKSTWEGEAKPYDFDHTMLSYVIPLISEVRITLEGRLD